MMNAGHWRKLLSKLVSYEGMTWAVIEQAIGGKAKGNNNHFVDVERCQKRAQDRLKQIGLEDIDRIYSLRLEGKLRLYGLREGAILILLWHDPHHDTNRGVCPG